MRIETRVTEQTVEVVDGRVEIEVTENVQTVETLTGVLNLTRIYNNSNYVHLQPVSSATWTVTHGLGKYPSVTVVDSDKRVCVGNVQYNSANVLTLTFSAAFSGSVYCN